jgi:hypothetical protein
LSIIRGPFSVAPCQTLTSRFATLSSLYVGGGGGGLSTAARIRRRRGGGGGARVAWGAGRGARALRAARRRLLHAGGGPVLPAGEYRASLFRRILLKRVHWLLQSALPHCEKYQQAPCRGFASPLAQALGKQWIGKQRQLRMASLDPTVSRGVKMLY